MERLFQSADRYLRSSSWKDLALIKFCLFAIGLLTGLGVSQRHKKWAGIAAAVVFLGTYIPLMAKFLPLLFGDEQE